MKLQRLLVALTVVNIVLLTFSWAQSRTVAALSGPSGTRDTYVQLGAKGNASSLTLRNEDGREQILKP
jgi:hypothetical protein